MSENAEQRPDMLYHYTSLAAFRTIFEQRIIRATRYDQMNDPTELSIGIEKLIETVKQHPVEDADREYKECLIEGIEQFKSAALHVYVLSFSATPDSLPQWREYVPNG